MAWDCSVEAEAKEDCENELVCDVLKFLDEHNAGNSTLHTINPILFYVLIFYDNLKINIKFTFVRLFYSWFANSSRYSAYYTSWT